jgi:hypothetical protein
VKLETMHSPQLKSMLITINQIIVWHDDEINKTWDERVLHTFLETGEVVTIDAKAKNAIPIFRRIEDLEEEIERGMQS